MFFPQKNLTPIKSYAIGPIPSLSRFNLTDNEEHLHSSNAERRSAQNRAAASLHTAGTAAGTSKEAREREIPERDRGGRVREHTDRESDRPCEDVEVLGEDLEQRSGAHGRLRPRIGALERWECRGVAVEVRRVVPALLNPPPFLPPSSPFGAFGVSRGENTGEESAVGKGEWSGADETTGDRRGSDEPETEHRHGNRGGVMQKSSQELILLRCYQLRHFFFLRNTV